MSLKQLDLMSTTPMSNKLKAASVEPDFRNLYPIHRRSIFFVVSVEVSIRGPPLPSVRATVFIGRGRLALLTCKKSDEVFDGHKIPYHPITIPTKCFARVVRGACFSPLLRNGSETGAFTLRPSFWSAIPLSQQPAQSQENPFFVHLLDTTSG